ncbi:hypothetical protein O181_010513 [Austropuccinia psidii MF-1]|uniref:Uncharacterized protein n=1 Tax=Austropuccinia psidii MF-1 TaxID=1389203 RepID=A0A9Q3GKF6_9BASI|nr:hypothetical protein [Austropuccinia psidii MF-1]
MDLGALKKVGHNEQVEVTTPFPINWNDGESRMVGDFRESNNNPIHDRYPIPRIHGAFTPLLQAKVVTAMDTLKGFHQSFLTENAKKLLRIIVH